MPTTVFVVLAQFGDDIGMLLGDIVALSAVIIHVVEFFAVDESPSLCHGRAFAPFDGVFHALRVRDDLCGRSSFPCLRGGV